MSFSFCCLWGWQALSSDTNPKALDFVFAGSVQQIEHTILQPDNKFLHHGGDAGRCTCDGDL